MGMLVTQWVTVIHVEQKLIFLEGGVFLFNRNERLLTGPKINIKLSKGKKNYI